MGKKTLESVFITDLYMKCVSEIMTSILGILHNELWVLCNNVKLINVYEILSAIFSKHTTSA